MHICYLESIRSPDGGTLSCNTLSCGTRDYCTLLHLRPRHLKLWHVKFRHLRKNTLCTGTSSRGCVQWIPAGRAEPNTWTAIQSIFLMQRFEVLVRRLLAAATRPVSYPAACPTRHQSSGCISIDLISYTRRIIICHKRLMSR